MHCNRLLRFTLPALFPALALLGCGWLGGGSRAMDHPTAAATPPAPSPTPTPAPASPPGVVLPAGRPGASKLIADLPAGSEQRPGNPAVWGEAAQIGVGRAFDAIRFNAGSDELDLEAQRSLREDALWLRANPRVWLVLEGHCDAASSARYSYAMGMSRALAAQDFLDVQGVSAQHVFCISYGRDRPAAPGSAPDANALNNRVEILPFLQPDGIEGPARVAATDASPPKSAKAASASTGEEIPR